MRILVSFFASEVHGEDYYTNALSIFKKVFDTRNVEVLEKPITNTDLAEKIAESKREYLPIITVLTGGTSSLIHRYVSRGGFNKVIILAHTEHNSIASAVSARSKIEEEGSRALLFWCEDLYGSECRDTIDKVLRIAGGILRVSSSRILVIRDSERRGYDEEFEKRFGSKISVLSIDHVLKLMSKQDLVLINEISREIESKYDFSLDRKDLGKIASLYIVMRDLSKQHDVISIDCFPFILRAKVTPCIPLSLLNERGIIATCEADLTVIPSMILARALSGRSGWIGNIASARGNEIMFSHCTIALDIVRGRARILSHFETSLPYAVSGEIAGDVATIISFSRDFTKAAIGRGRIKRSGLLSDKTCRTQVVLEMDSDAEKIPRIAPTNHHVLILGDYLSELRDITYIYGIDATYY